MKRRARHLETAQKQMAFAGISWGCRLLPSKLLSLLRCPCPGYSPLLSSHLRRVWEKKENFQLIYLDCLDLNYASEVMKI